MKQQISFFSLCFLSFGLFSCGQNNKTKEVQSPGANDQAQIELISAKELNSELDKDLKLIDVRTAQEFGSGAIKGAVNIDYSKSDFLKNMQAFGKGEPIYLYCRSGRRSASAARQLKEAGFTRIYDLKGGILAWQNENLPTE